MQDPNFISENPIKTEAEDVLSRKAFVTQLQSAINSWNSETSLIVSLNGKWGEGKSSVINLLKEKLRQQHETAPKIIEFNPWFYNSSEKLTSLFFDEISKNIGFRNGKESDIELASKLKLYSQLINFGEEKAISIELIQKILFGLSILGVSTGQILNAANNKKMSIVFSILGILFLVLTLSKEILKKLALIYEEKSKKHSTSIYQLKDDLKKILRKRDQKLLIVIDDIDRLSQKEIKEIFRIIRLNADFPNTMYLLAYDDNVVIKTIDKKNKNLGADYLKKIVQVNFNLPHVSQQKIYTFLFDHLNQIVNKLPDEGKRFWNEESEYWNHCFNSGYSDFFHNIRDVKRYYNSLSLNIKFLVKNQSYEVNPIDFFCIEVLRVFTPEFYSFIKTNKHLFTENSYSGISGVKQDDRKESIEIGFNSIPTNFQHSAKRLICNLFPQVESVINAQTVDYRHLMKDWRLDLRICSSEFFDAYFTLIPGGNEGEISQYELDTVIEETENIQLIEKRLNGYIKEQKIKQILKRIQDYTEKRQYFNTDKKIKNLITVLFNISDQLKSKSSMFEDPEEMSAMRIIYQLLKDGDQDDNFNILEETINKASGIYGPIYFLSLQTNNPPKQESDLVIRESQIGHLRNIALQKLTRVEPETLIDNQHFFFLVLISKHWGSFEIIQAIHEKLKPNKNLLFKLYSKFVNKSYSSSFGSSISKEHRKINFSALEEIVGLDKLSPQLKEISKTNPDLYKLYNDFIDQYNNEIEKYLSSPEGYMKNPFDD